MGAPFGSWFKHSECKDQGGCLDAGGIVTDIKELLTFKYGHGF